MNNESIKIVNKTNPSLMLTSRIQHPMQVYRSIFIESEFLEMHGYLNYLRNVYDGYDIKKGDYLDDTILRETQSRFKESRFNGKRLLLFQEDFDDAKRKTNLERTASIDIVTYPILNLDSYDSKKDYYRFSKEIFLKYSVSKRRMDIVDGLLFSYAIYIDLPPDQTHSMIKSIDPVMPDAKDRSHELSA